MRVSSPVEPHLQSQTFRPVSAKQRAIVTSWMCEKDYWPHHSERELSWPLRFTGRQVASPLHHGILAIRYCLLKKKRWYFGVRVSIRPWTNAWVVDLKAAKTDTSRGGEERNATINDRKTQSVQLSNMKQGHIHWVTNQMFLFFYSGPVPRRQRYGKHWQRTQMKTFKCTAKWHMNDN